MSEHPIESLMEIAMNNIEDMVDVNTIIGEPIYIDSNITIIPVSKVSFGFLAGGSEFNTETIEEYKKEDRDEKISYKNPFGGGSGAGVNITPMSFLIINKGNIKLMPVEYSSTIDKLVDFIPDIINKAREMMDNKENNKNNNEKEDKTEEQIFRFKYDNKDNLDDE